MATFLERLTGADKTKKLDKKEEDASKKKSKKSKKDKKKKLKLPSGPKEKKPDGRLAIDLWPTADELILKSTIAGVRNQDLDIAIANQSVEIKGKRYSGDSIPKDNCYYQECYWGNFSRKVDLPVEIDADKAKASLKDGILTILMPKLSKTQVKKLEVS